MDESITDFICDTQGDLFDLLGLSPSPPPFRTQQLAPCFTPPWTNPSTVPEPRLPSYKQTETKEDSTDARINEEAYRTYFLERFRRLPAGTQDPAWTLKSFLKDVTAKAKEQQLQISQYYSEAIEEAKKTKSTAYIIQLQRAASIHASERLAFFEHNIKAGVSIQSVITANKRQAESDYAKGITDLYDDPTEELSSSDIHDSSLPPSSPPPSKALVPLSADDRLDIAVDECRKGKKKPYSAALAYKVNRQTIQNRLDVGFIFLLRTRGKSSN